jgi:hypothetical protein
MQEVGESKPDKSLADHVLKQSNKPKVVFEGFSRDKNVRKTELYEQAVDILGEQLTASRTYEETESAIRIAISTAYQAM